MIDFKLLLAFNFCFKLLSCITLCSKSIANVVLHLANYENSVVSMTKFHMPLKIIELRAFSKQFSKIQMNVFTISFTAIISTTYQQTVRWVLLFLSFCQVVHFFQISNYIF